MAKFLVEDTSLASVADAIRSKTGSTDSLVFPDGFAEAIAGIKAGGGSVKIATGVIIPAKDITGDIDITHNLGEIPKMAIVCRELSADGFANETCVSGEVMFSMAINREKKGVGYYMGGDRPESSLSVATGQYNETTRLDTDTIVWLNGSCVHSCTETTAKLYPIKNGTKKFAAGNKYRWILFAEEAYNAL